MKFETKVSDLTKYVSVLDAERNVKKHKDILLFKASNDTESEASVLSARQDYIEALKVSRKNTEAFDKLPKVRRTLAEDTYTKAEAFIRGVMKENMSSLSGHTTQTLKWISNDMRAFARVTTAPGARYGKTTFRKTDAQDLFGITPKGVMLLLEYPGLVAASNNEGLPLIELNPDNSCTWVRRSRCKVACRHRWIAYDESEHVCFHSEVSYARAQAGLKNKVEKLREERERERKARLAHRFSDEGRKQRRSSLVSRLCNGVKATLQDAKELGFCDPGIRAFQEQFGIGDSATLPELIKTGDPHATRLALAVARRITRSAEPETA